MNVDLVEHACCNCGMTFWITVKMDSQKQRDHTSFYCPAGHSQSYTGETEAQKNLKRYQEEFNKRIKFEDELSKTKADLKKCLNNQKPNEESPPAKPKRGRPKKQEEVKHG